MLCPCLGISNIPFRPFCWKNSSQITVPSLRRHTPSLRSQWHRITYVQKVCFWSLWLRDIVGKFSLYFDPEGIGRLNYRRPRCICQQWTVHTLRRFIQCDGGALEIFIGVVFFCWLLSDYYMYTGVAAEQVFGTGLRLGMKQQLLIFSWKMLQLVSIVRVDDGGPGR